MLGLHDDRRSGHRHLQRQHPDRRAGGRLRAVAAAPACVAGSAAGASAAYAYFLYPPEKPLTETAHDRLATIAQHTDLGSGMHVAMKDLEIRGAGQPAWAASSPGTSQASASTSMSDSSARRSRSSRASAGRGTDRSRSRSSCPVDAHLPHDYIAHERLRLEAYQRLAAGDRRAPRSRRCARSCSTATARCRCRSRRSFEVAPVARRWPGRPGSARSWRRATTVRFAPVELPESGQLRLQRLYPKTLVKPAVRTILVPRPTSGTRGWRADSRHRHAGLVPRAHRCGALGWTAGRHVNRNDGRTLVRRIVAAPCDRAARPGCDRV